MPPFQPFSLAPQNRSPSASLFGGPDFITNPNAGVAPQLDPASIGGVGGFQTFAQNQKSKNIAQGGTPGFQPTALPGFGAVTPQALSPATLQFLQSQGLLNPAEVANLTTAAQASFGNRTGGDPFQRPANDPFNPFSGRPTRTPQPGAAPAPQPPPGGGGSGGGAGGAGGGAGGSGGAGGGGVPAPAPPPQGGGLPPLVPPALAPNFRPLPVGFPPPPTPLPQDPSGLSQLNPLRADQAAQEGVFTDPNLISQSPAFSQFGNLFGGSLNTFDPAQDPFAAGRNSSLFNLLSGPFAGDPFGLPGKPTATGGALNFQLSSALQREREIQDARNQLQFGQQQLLNDPGLQLGRGVADFLGRDPFTTSSDALQREEEGLLTRRINTAAQGALGTASDRSAALGLGGGESSLVRAGVDFGGRAALADALAQSRIGQSQRRAQDLQAALGAGQTVSNQALSNIFGPAATRAQFEGGLFRPEQQQFIRDLSGVGNIQIAEALAERAKGSDIGAVLGGIGALGSVVGNVGLGLGSQGFNLFGKNT